MAINFNTGPYFDDFDVAKDFYRVLFKPGYAVQARELNQLQSILQHQVAGVGNHLFRKNSMVIPGGIALISNAAMVFVSSNNDQLTDISSLVGKTITNAPAFDYTVDSDLDGYITAVVLAYKEATTSTPAALYVKYVKSNNDGRLTFDTSETLKTVEGTSVTFTTDADTPSGVGKIASIAKGLFYTSDLFVDCQAQTIIVETNSNTITNCDIGLNIVESIVTSDEDTSLLDNANGAPNQYAPGADRYKVQLNLVRVDPTTITDPDKFINMMTIENDVITYLNDTTQYAEIMKTMARRTYDANGNFVVQGLSTSASQTLDGEYIKVNVSKGKCYLGGYEYSQIADRPITIRKPRDVAYTQNVPTVTKYASGLTWFYAAAGALMLELPAADTLVEFLNAAPGTTGVQAIGYGVFKDIQYYSGSIGDNDIYKVFFDLVTLSDGYGVKDIGGFKVIAAAQGAPILHQISMKNLTGLFTTGNVIKSVTRGNQAVTFTDAGDLVTLTRHGLKNGDAVIFSSITSTTGISINTRYYVVTATDDTFQVSTTKGGAVSGLTTNGTGVLLGQSGTIFDVDNFSILYVLKDTLVEVPNTETIRDNSTNAVGTLTNYYVSNYTESLSPILKVDDSTIKHVGDVSYSVVKKTVISITSIDRAETINAGTGEVFEDFSTSDYYAYVVEDGTWMTLSGVLTVSTPTQLSFNLGSNSAYDGKTIWLYSTVVKSNSAASEKTKTSTYINIANPSAAYMALGHADVIKITKVTDSGNPAVAATLNDTDITSRFILENGNTIYGSSTSLIKLRKRATPPIGQIAVQYTYYSIGTGNYVSVDSYGTYNNTDGIDGDADLGYIGQIADVYDKKKNLINIRNYLDFRTRTSNYFFKNQGVVKIENLNKIILKDLNLSYYASTLVGKYVVGPGFENGVTISSVAITNGTTVLTLSSSSTAGISVGFDATDDYVNLTGHNLANGTPVKFSVINSTTGISINTTYYVVNRSSFRFQLSDTINGSPKALTTNGTGTLIRGTKGVYYIGLNGSGLSLVDTGAGGKSFTFPKDSAFLSYDYIKFLIKKIMVYVERTTDGLSVKFSEIAEFDDAYKLRRNEYKLPLMYMEMEPYTVSLNNVKIYTFDNPVYKMLDIHNLKLRLDRAEYYSQLAIDNDVNQAIYDANNLALDEYRYGYWNENFMDPLKHDFNSDDFACTIYDKSYVSPGTVTRTVNLQLNPFASPSTWKQTGSSITLPYVEVVAISNNQASTINNLNPFGNTNYPGKLTLNPNVDNWVDTTVSPEVVVINNVKHITNSTVATLPVTSPPKVTDIQTPSVIKDQSEDTKNIIVPPPIVVTQPPFVLPSPVTAVIERIKSITNLITNLIDSRGNKTGVSFDWETNKGTKGSVVTDSYLSLGKQAVVTNKLVGNNRDNDDNEKDKILQKPSTRRSISSLIGKPLLEAKETALAGKPSSTVPPEQFNQRMKETFTKITRK
jgi:hypothetical protein